MRWHHFLCCLPLRLGVLIIAALTLAGSTLVAVGAWINVHNIINHTLELSKTGEITVYIVAGVYTLVAITSLLGLVGALTARPGLVSTFNSLQIGSFIISLAIGAYSLYLLFSNKYEIDTSNCINSVDATTSADTAKQVCDTALKVSKAVVVVIYGIIWLVQFYGLFIVHSYVRELEEKRFARYKYVTVAP